ncbi:MAG: hypothetical protein R8G66_04850 [Cytophagales bacterium]|nr:hypothetical protein [Cytophagales bacterium]
MRNTFFLILIVLSIQVYSQEDKTLWTAAWSPDDELIAIGGSQGELKLFDGTSFELLKTYSVGDVILSRLKWHPTQNKLAVITQSQSFKAKILDLNEEKWIELEGLESSIRGLDWNQDGELLAVSEFEGEISIFDTSGKRVSRFIADDKSVAGIDWHPSENILVAVGSTIGLFTHLGDSIKIFSPREKEVFLLCVEWHPSGEFFVTGDYGEFEDGENKLLQYWSKEGEKLNETGRSIAEYRNIRWSPNGKSLASANDALNIWDHDGKLLHQSERSDDYLWGVDWNADGSQIITTSDRGVIALWDSEANLIQRIEY